MRKIDKTKSETKKKLSDLGKAIIKIMWRERKSEISFIFLLKIFSKNSW